MTTIRSPSRPCVMNCLVPLMTQLVAVADGRRAHRRRVAAGRGLGQSPRRQLLAARRAAPGSAASAPRCRTGRCARRRARCARRSTGRPTGRRAPAPRCRCSSRPTTSPRRRRLRETGSPSARARRTWRARSRGKCCASSHSRTCGRSSRFGELAHAAPQQLLLVREAEVHAGAHRIIGVCASPARSFSPQSACSPRPRHAFADVTVFLGSTSTPAARQARGLRPRRRHPRPRIRVRVLGHARGPDWTRRRRCAPAWATSCCRRRSRLPAFSPTSRPARRLSRVAERRQRDTARRQRRRRREDAARWAAARALRLPRLPAARRRRCTTSCTASTSERTCRSDGRTSGFFRPLAGSRRLAAGAAPAFRQERVRAAARESATDSAGCRRRSPSSYRASRSPAAPQCPVEPDERMRPSP